LSALPRVTDLIGAEAVAMSDTIIIQTVYIAIGPFFVVEASEGNAKGRKDSGASHLIHNVLGSSAMHGLHWMRCCWFAV
jgi:cohesin loading factor subunit SCC2